MKKKVKGDPAMRFVMYVHIILACECRFASRSTPTVKAQPMSHIESKINVNMQAERSKTCQCKCKDERHTGPNETPFAFYDNSAVVCARSLAASAPSQKNGQNFLFGRQQASERKENPLRKYMCRRQSMGSG